MFKDKEAPYDLREERKEISMCDTSHFNIFFWSYLIDLCNCFQNVKSMIFPTCLQSFDFRNFSCSTSVFIVKSHKSHI